MGIFITLEGGEGAGKSTQAKLLADKLKKLGHDCVLTREPGGTVEAEAIRNLLVSGDTSRWSAEAEALLNYAARDSHLRGLIVPVLESGKTVICDRFIDSTLAYQHFAGGADAGLIETLRKHIVANHMPDLTIIFDLDPQIGLQRAASRNDGAGDRFERKGLSFHQNLRSAFQKIAASEPKRCRIIDASRSAEQLADEVWLYVTERLDG